MKKLTLFLAILLSVFSCQKDALQELPKETSAAASTQEDRYTQPYDFSTLRSRSACAWTEVPGGSTDALAAAIEATCEDGIVYLRAGTHTQNSVLTITKSVKIIGEAGTVLRIQAPALTLSSDSTLLDMVPAVHVLNAPRTLIQDLTIQPLGAEGGAAIVFENSPGSAAMRNDMSGFQSNILIEKSDRVTVMFNKIVSRTPWGVSRQPAAFGVLNVDGKSTYISDNDISGALWAIFVSDFWGTIERNKLHDNNFGVNICGFRAAYVLPNGSVPAKEESAAGWKVRNNTITDSNSSGILVIDGSNGNIVENNDLSGNRLQDIELTTTTSRNGFVAQASYNNTVIAGSYPAITIKDCGNNNTISGGVMVDTTVSPCN